MIPETDLAMGDVLVTGYEHQRPPELQDRPIGFGPVRVMSCEPPVFLCGMPYDQFQGFAPAFGKRYGSRGAAFLVVPTWSIEDPERIVAIARTHRWHVERYPAHRLRYLANTPREEELLREHGLPVDLLNHKLTVSDEVFAPLPDASVEFDAIYNARLVAGKRHELAALVPTVAYLAYAEEQRSRQREFRALARRILRPGHVLLNEVVGGLPVRMPHAEVNRALNRAAVGLLLSEVEGASYAAVEYLLAGLPVVTTPSLGGREEYLDPEVSIVCEPTPEAVRAAVADLVARELPREYVRERALARIAPQRQRLLAKVEAMRAELGGSALGHDGDWPFGKVSGLPWATFNEHLAGFEDEQRRELSAELGIVPESLRGVQLTVHELRPVLAAIAARPGCALLVFGAGNDSALWERANAGGTTAFVEHDAAWATRVRATLTSAQVHEVSYRTRTDQWTALLERPDELALDLPPAVRDQAWDVILVDGPAAYADVLPGRMCSIYEAARLVAPAGRVFVHDAERPAEAAYAARYLGEARCVAEVQGRALLREYAF